MTEVAMPPPVGLKGTLPSGATVSLKYKSGGLWLIGGDERIPVQTLVYKSGRLSDELEIAGSTFGIPTGKGAAVRSLIVRWRLGALQLPVASTIEEADESTCAWLASWLEEAGDNVPAEEVLALLATSLTQSIPSEIGAEQEVGARFLLTSRRAALVAVTNLGDVWVRELSHPITVVSERGRDRVRSGESEWLTSLTNEARYHQVAPWTCLSEPERLRASLEAALDEKKLDRAEQLAACLPHDPRAQVALWARKSLKPSPSDDTFAAFEASLPADRIASWADAWGIEDERRHALVERLKSHSSKSAHSLALHDDVRVRDRQKKGPVDVAGVQVRWAAHLHESERGDEAAAVLDAALAELSDGDAMDLVPHGELNERNPQVHARVSLLEAKRDLTEGKPHFDATRALARLEPLQAERVRALNAVASPPLSDRASVIGSLLADGVESAGLSMPPDDTVLPDESLALLRHPVGRTDEFVGAISTYVASVERPDHSALRAYCPRLTDPVRQEVFARAAKRLGVDADVYVSRGDASLGCRAHEDDESKFVVLGGTHVDESSPRFLSPTELAFAFGSELAHLRFGHSRVTSSEVWKGAFNLGVSGFDILVSSVPLLGRYRIGDGISKVANAIKDGTAEKLTRRARKLFGSGKKEAKSDPASDQASDPAEAEGKADSAAQAAGQLIAAHRLMQLGADRAGLLLCGHPAPAIKAMLALDPGDALEHCRADGLFLMATRRSKNDMLVHPELALRICALLSFWLSEDYETLATTPS